MNTLQKLYLLRLILGLVAAMICVGYNVASSTVTSDPAQFKINTLLNSISISLAAYLVSYYFLKRKFMLQVEKPTKLVTTGIGIYFIAWLVFYILLYTIMATMLGV